MKLQELLRPLVYPQLVYCQTTTQSGIRHVRQFFDDEASNDDNGDIGSYYSEYSDYDQTLRGFIVPDDHADEGSGGASEPEGAGGSAAAEGADASAAAERTRSGRRGMPPRRPDGVMRGQRCAD